MVGLLAGDANMFVATEPHFVKAGQREDFTNARQVVVETRRH
jgi:hypothetical protein